MKLRKFDENEFINENNENTVDDDSSDVATMENLLEHSKKSFFELFY